MEARWKQSPSASAEAASPLQSHQPARHNTCPTPWRQFDHRVVNATQFVEADLDSTLPRRGDGLQTGSLTFDA
jgi:hypothetical protein